MYQYGNVAVQYQKEKQRRPQPSQQKQGSIEQARSQEQFTSKIGTAGKLFYIFLVISIVAIASLLLSRNAAVNQLNYEVQFLEKELQAINEQNINLQLQVADQSSPERIIKVATIELGMTKTDSTVRILSRAETNGAQEAKEAMNKDQETLNE